jgi:pimeloyl-ACP methyl ester carboxylesterase
LVRKLVAASATFNTGGMHPELPEMIETITPEVFAGSPYEAAYLEVAPNPGDFPTLVEKLKRLDLTPQDWPPESIRGIAAPTMIVIGDSDAVRLEHAVEMFELLGGGVMGDLVGLPNAQLAVLPGTTHVGVVERADWLLSMIGEFLDAPRQDAE